MSEAHGGLRQVVVRAGETATEPFDWGEITWLDNAEITGSETLTVGRVTIRAGQANPEHYHPNCDEVLFVISGNLEHSLDGAWHHLAPGDIIHIPCGAKHQGKNTGSVDAEVLVTYNTGRRETIGSFGAGER